MSSDEMCFQVAAKIFTESTAGSHSCYHGAEYAAVNAGPTTTAALITMPSCMLAFLEDNLFTHWSVLCRLFCRPEFFRSKMYAQYARFYTM